MREFILRYSSDITEGWKFNTPFYYYKGKWMAFISYGHKNHEIYIAFVNGYKMTHPALKSEGRKKQKIYRINPNADIDIKTLTSLMELAIAASKPE